MANLPSIKELCDSAQSTFLRFPLTILSGVGAAILLLLDIHVWKTSGSNTIISNAVLALTLGLVLSFGLQLFAENRTKLTEGVCKWKLLHWAALPVAIFCFWMLELRDVSRVYFQYSQFSLAFHLFVAIAPFLGQGAKAIDSFWNFNRTLFVRFLQATVFSATLFLGLAAAVAAINLLFVKDLISNKIYQDTFIAVSLIFHPWFFLVGVPRQIQSNFDYPRILRNFLQFLLIPLLCLYLAILGAYLLKIAYAVELPKGWVSYLVSAASLFGILSLLLGYPLWSRREPPWMAKFARVFYWTLLPLLGLMALGLVTRVGEYGWTESRYFLVLLNLWLLGVVIYYGILGREDIRRIPQSLFILSFITAWGPWGAASVSLRSQRANFERILKQAGLWENGKAIPAPATKEIDFETRRQLSSVVDYLVDRHGHLTLMPFLADDFKKTLENESGARDLRIYSGRRHTIRAYSFSPKLFQHLNLAYVNSWEQKKGDSNASGDKQSFNVTCGKTVEDYSTIEVRGFDYVLSAFHWRKIFKFQNSDFNFEWRQDDFTKFLVRRNDTLVADLPLKEWISQLLGPKLEALGQQNYSIDTKNCIFNFENETLRIRILVQHALGRKTEDGNYLLTHLNAHMLLDEK